MRPEPHPVPGLLERLPDLESETWADPSPRNVMGLAEAYRLLGRPTRAIETLGPVVAEDAAAIAPRVLLSWCLAEAGRTEEAAALLTVVRGLDPANPYARPEPAAAAGAPGATATVREAEEGAGEPAETSGEIAPPTPASRDAADAGRPGGGESEAEPERALTAEELSRIPPSPLYSATLAEIFERQGFEEKAIEIYEQVVRAHPDRADLRDRIVALRSRLETRPS